MTEEQIVKLMRGLVFPNDRPLYERLLEERRRLLEGIKLLLMCSLPSDVSGERMVQQARAALAFAESPAP